MEPTAQSWLVVQAGQSPAPPEEVEEDEDEDEEAPALDALLSAPPVPHPARPRRPRRPRRQSAIDQPGRDDARVMSAGVTEFKGPSSDAAGPVARAWSAADSRTAAFFLARSRGGLQRFSKKSTEGQA
jgi:hypothetical protein